jgi:NhaA family Na+:H+ antiporter
MTDSLTSGTLRSSPSSAMRAFLSSEAAGGAALVLAAVIAIALANSPFADQYDAFLALRAKVQVDGIVIDKPLLLWINDGLMAIFFLLVGLELKREFLEGELSTRAQALLPAVCAIGGMIVPALIYLAVNINHPENRGGWAIPAATDIAFALGVLAILGSRIPSSIKVLLMAIAVFDDLGAIIIIALFYTQDLSLLSLVFAAAAMVVLVALNLLNVRRIAPYVLVGVVLWVCVLKSGVHATLAGVVLALVIPSRRGANGAASPLEVMEHGLQPWVAFAVLPIFGFANAGLSFQGFGWQSLLDPVQLGIFLGLFLGKQIGIFGALKLMVGRGFVPMPEGGNWKMLYGVACLCGIGFTMSLFIGGLAWEHADFAAQIRLGVIEGSLVSAALGLAVLMRGTAATGRSAP